MIFDHFNIDVSADLLLETKAFYENIFDMREGFRPKLSRKGFWMYFEEKPILHIFQRTDSLPNNSQSYLDHIAFQLPNIERFKARLTEYNVPFRSIKNEELNILQLFIHDPANVKIECIFKIENTKIL